MLEKELYTYFIHLKKYLTNIISKLIFYQRHIIEKIEDFR